VGPVSVEWLASSISSVFCGLPQGSEATKKTLNSFFSILQSSSIAVASAVPVVGLAREARVLLCFGVSGLYLALYLAVATPVPVYGASPVRLWFTPVMVFIGYWSHVNESRML
jgi:hypothetical protein